MAAADWGRGRKTVFEAGPVPEPAVIATVSPNHQACKRTRFPGVGWAELPLKPSWAPTLRWQRECSLGQAPESAVLGSQPAGASAGRHLCPPGPRGCGASR